MVTGRYPVWKDGYPICPACRKHYFDVAIMEIVSYSLNASKPIDAIDNFYIHEYLENINPPLVSVMCSNCHIDIVITDKMKEFLKDV